MRAAIWGKQPSRRSSLQLTSAEFNDRRTADIQVKVVSGRRARLLGEQPVGGSIENNEHKRVANSGERKESTWPTDPVPVRVHSKLEPSFTFGRIRVQSGFCADVLSAPTSASYWNSTGSAADLDELVDRDAQVATLILEGAQEQQLSSLEEFR